jgi:hypothetical protein
LYTPIYRKEFDIFNYFKVCCTLPSETLDELPK